MNCLIENEYIQGKKSEKDVSIHKWIAWLKTNTKGKKNGKKREKQVGVLYYGGVY
jgi:hypothetical protein